MKSSIKIETQGLHLYYGSFHALKDVNILIKDRQITALIGPSGCGKSTFLRTLNRMNELIPHTRTEGRVTLDGEDIYQPRTDVVSLRKRVGMVFQRPNPFPKSIFENVAFGLRVLGIFSKREIEEKVEQSLKDAAIWPEVSDRLHRNALSLTLGQQQRLCIARSLALEPEVLLLDEPTSGLDPISTGKVEESLFALRKHYTIIIVPHSIQQAARVADHASFFLAGELIEHQSGRGIFTAPADKRTEDYITGRFG